MFRRKSWGWLVALGVLTLAFGPISIALYRSWRDGIGVGIVMPANVMILVAVGWVAQLVVAVCFVVARGGRAPTPGTP